MRSIDRWKQFLADELGLETPPHELRTLVGRTLSIDDGKRNEFDVEFSESGEFVRIISYKQEKRGIKY